jgi:hypothetical protein
MSNPELHSMGDDAAFTMISPIREDADMRAFS